MPHPVCKFMFLSFTACVLVYLPQILAYPGESYHHRDGLHTPCTFFDTVNVTSDTKFENGSYLHDGVLIPRHLVGLYDYIYKDLVTREEVPPHYRGCICKVKPCINFCCPWGTIYNSNLSSCVNTSEEHQWPEPTINITLPDSSLKTVNIFEQFAVQNFRPCKIMFSLIPEMYYYDGWELFSNGTMFRLDDEIYFVKNEFCLVPTVVNETDLFYKINPANCKVSSEYGTMKIINAYAMLFSIPFMVLTIVVYLLIPELRNQHGKSLVCYLMGLIVGYTLLSSTSLLNDLSPGSMSCKIIGYTAYYFFMAAFLWLNVISFDLWHNFRGTRGINRLQEKKRFLFYSLYAWGLAAVSLVFTWFAEEQLDVSEYYKPGIGSEYCWLDMRTWSAMIYFFGPILIIILANTVMFVMTAMKIHKVQVEMARIMAREDSTRNLRTEKDKFGLFLRLFIVMGVTWCLEIMSYFVGPDKAWAKIFYITDICNAIQGFLIFMLFVMKKKVKHLITNRYSSTRDSSNQRQSQYSTKTTSSSVNLSLTEKPLVPYERTISLKK
ncbi:G-protein coupled receptor Mth2-like isoform X2 [Teleopsis dalmanni]|uniref:G-protein coupled receptor Mth2-like isoform X2 n=1 Tax=Teleopsis dalmanni TaxID=139649 RepID=UPI0018CF5030|nr:G-protein coupled receptor Mth2-like isoform X2 [Teleopsis dalmanni]